MLVAGDWPLRLDGPPASSAPTAAAFDEHMPSLPARSQPPCVSTYWKEMPKMNASATERHRLTTGVLPQDAGSFTALCASAGHWCFGGH